METVNERCLCRVRYRAASTGGKERDCALLQLRLFVHDRAVYLLCRFRGHAACGGSTCTGPWRSP